MALETGNSLYWKARLETSDLERDAHKTKGIFATLARNITPLDLAIAGAVKGLHEMKQGIVEMTKLAARYETMGVVMRTVGNNAGYNTEQLEAYQEALEKTGISMLQARQNITRMIQANLDLNKSTELARIAQDAAVIGNINSSEAFERMIYGIQSAQVEMLRTIGINVNFENAYQKVAKATGRAATEFTEAEKAAIRMNAVLESGEKIAGTYEAAMDTAGKQMTSLQRHTENLKVKLGLLFTPALLEAVQAITGEITEMNDSMDKSQEKVEAWGNNFRLILIQIEAQVMRLAMLIDKIGGTMTSIGASISFWGLQGMLGIPQASGLTDKFAEWNKAYEDRYNQTLSDLEALAKKYDEITFSMSDTGKAAAKSTQDAKEAEVLARQKAAAALDAEKAAVEGLNKAYRELLWGEKKQADIDRLVEREQRVSAQYAPKPQELPPEFTRSQEWQQEYAVEMALIAEQEKEKNQKASLDRMFKNIRNMNERELQGYSEFLSAQAALHKDNESEYLVILEERQRVMQSIYDAELRKLSEIGDVITGIGDLVGRFDKNLGEQARDLGNMVTSIRNMQNATTGWGEAAGLLQVAAAVDDWADKLSKYLVKAQETTRGKEPMSLYWDGWDQFIVAQKEFQISITAGEARVKRMEELIAYLETQLEKNWKKLDPLDRIQAQRDIEDQKQRLLEYTTGTTADALTSGIVDGFMAGKSAAQVFADSFEDLMKGALRNTFEQQAITKLIQPFYDQFAELSSDGLTSQDIDYLKSLYQGVIAGADQLGKNFEQVFPDLFAASNTSATGLSGAVKGITEQTAGALEGQFMGMRMNMIDLLDAADRQLTKLNRIADNTEFNRQYFPRIDATLRSIDLAINNGSIRAIGG